MRLPADVSDMGHLVRLSHWLCQRSLVLRFAVVSAGLVGALGGALTTWQANAIRDANIGTASTTATYSMNVALGVIGAKTGGPAQITAVQYVQVTGLLRAIVNTGKYIGATAWAPANRVVYAKEPGRTGRQEMPRPQVGQAFRGRQSTLVVRTSIADVPDATERAALRQSGSVLEVFVPVRLDGSVVAVVELYQPWQPVQRAIANQTRQTLLFVCLGLLVLWAGLLSLVLTASRRLRAQSALNRRLASHDALTGLPNRTLLADRGAKALQASARSGHRVGVMLLDLDKFKEVNDTLGHHNGDLLLQQAAGRLTGVLRAGDSAARLGGDEFVVLLPDLASAVEAVEVAQRIIAAFTVPFLVDAISLEMEVSIGIAISPDHGTNIDTLLQHADIGMYDAKGSRAGLAVYAAETDARTRGRLGLLSQLRTGVNDPTQLVVHYQPKADMLTGEVRGVEALVRWQHPTDGLILPADFIPLAEQSGLIHPLTEHVLTQALTQICEWDKAGLTLPVAVNVSTRCLLDTNFPSLVSRLLREHHVSARQLELEITESAVMADPDKAISVLENLRRLGVSLTVDDFGTGYSSLSRLKALPVQQLKIDKSFVTNMNEGSPDAAIVKSCIELGRNLGLTVVAEGVETPHVWHQLTNLGCDQAQGYYLATPMPADLLWGWMIRRGELIDVVHTSASRMQQE